MRKTLRRTGSVILLAITSALAGCGPMDEHDQGSDLTAYILRQNLWSTTSIPVCWLNPSSSNAKQRQWVKSAIEREYESRTHFRFTGWTAGCRNAPANAIRINISDVRGWSRVGRTSASPSMTFSLTHNNFMSWCRRSEATLRKCIEGTAIHEFGHAVGLIHEQDRSDSTCHNSANTSINGFAVGRYDPSSIMNYCNPRVYTDPRLSAGDIAGVRYLADLIRANQRGR